MVWEQLLAVQIELGLGQRNTLLLPVVVLGYTLHLPAVVLGYTLHLPAVVLGHTLHLPAVVLGRTLHLPAEMYVVVLGIDAGAALAACRVLHCIEVVD